MPGRGRGLLVACGVAALWLGMPGTGAVVPLRTAAVLPAPGHIVPHLPRPAARAAPAPEPDASRALGSVLAASMAPPPGRPRWVPEEPVYGLFTASNLPVKMADGVVLRANVLFPADPGTGVPAVGSFPVLLTQTPYGKALSGPEPDLVRRGFIEVIADVRGTGDSHGQFGLLDPAQISDGVTLVRWAAALPHSNGRVGLFGGSYLGINQLLTAAAVGPDSPLKAIFPAVAASDVYRDMAVMGGIPDAEFSGYFLGLTAGMNAALPLKEGTAAGADQGTPAEMTTVEKDHLSGDFHATYLTNLLQGGDLAYDGGYWAARRPRSVLGAIVANRIPAYLVGGWRDIFQRGEPLNYTGLQNAWAGRPVEAAMRPDQPVTGRYQLLMGPWYHGNVGQGVNLTLLELQWFDTWLRGEPTGVDRTPTPLHIYEVGGDRYVEASHWPLRQAHPERLYLSQGRTGVAPWSLNDGGMTVAPPALGADPVAFQGASTPCSASTDQWAGGLLTLTASTARREVVCTEDDRAGQVGPGVLTYTTGVLSEPMVIGGPIGVTLFATSTSPDAEFVVTVEDVGADGVSTPLTQGALLGSLRAVDAGSWAAADGGLLLPHHPLTRPSESLLTPDQVTRFDIEVYPVYALIRKGHTFRLTIATSDTPHLVPTPEQLAHLAGGVYQVLHGGSAASYVELDLAD
ncbi:MAG: CocE/NonD family hydrolase [Chloroflexi bacterium]|nr:MAG: CocE/NonD family hydrolase [Chloroflexota bacterium]